MDINLDLKDLITQHKNAILNILILLLALHLANNLHKKQTQEIGKLEEKIDIETKKNVVLEEIRLSERKIYAYRSLLNQKDIASTINKLNDIANEFSVNIRSIRPITEKTVSVLTEYPFSLKVEVNNYHDLGRFISKLESHPDVYRVEVMSINPEYSEPGGQVSKILVDIEIHTFLLK